MANTDLPHVTIIILNWKKPHETVACLESLDAVTYPNLRVIVVENGSGDDSVGVIGSYLPRLRYKVEIIVNGRNLGFAGGNNVGMRQALACGTDYILLLNDDTVVAPDFLESLVHVAEADPHIGMVGPKIYYFADQKRIWSAGGEFVRGGITRQRGVNMLDTPELNTARQVDYVTGCALLVKREVIDAIGMLDDRFFAYYEEADWCARAAGAGYAIWYVPQSVIWHKISLDARGNSPLYMYLMTRNRLLFMHNRGFPSVRIWWSVLTLDIRTVLAWTLKPRHRSSRPMRRWRLQGVYDYLRGCFGRPTFMTDSSSR